MPISSNERGNSYVTGKEDSEEKKKDGCCRPFSVFGGAYEDRTHDLQIANLALSQLS